MENDQDFVIGGDVLKRNNVYESDVTILEGVKKIGEGVYLWDVRACPSTPPPGTLRSSTRKRTASNSKRRQDNGA